MFKSDDDRFNPSDFRVWRARGRLGEYAAKAAAGILAATVLTLAAAQQVFAQSGGNFQQAPRSAEADANANSALDAAGGGDMILGYSVNMMFFIAVAVFALFWFTLGGGRKIKVGRTE